MRRLSPRVPVLAALAGLVTVTVSACGVGSTPADADALATQASRLGVDPALIFTTHVDGYDLAAQSVGPADADGLSATWVDEDTAAMITIRTSAGEPDARSCAALPLWDTGDEPATCTEVATGLWHREGVQVHEYLASRDGTTIWVFGANGTPADDLREAAEAARIPSDAELEALFADAPTGDEVPVERGDLPEHGDGAPIQPTGPGG